MTRIQRKGLLASNEVFSTAMRGRSVRPTTCRDLFVIALVVSLYRSVGSLPDEDREKRHDPVSFRRTDDTTLLLPWFFQVAGSPNPVIPLNDPGPCFRFQDFPASFFGRGTRDQKPVPPPEDRIYRMRNIL